MRVVTEDKYFVVDEKRDPAAKREAFKRFGV